MNEIAKKLFHDHKNPVVKLDLIGTKLFFKASTPEDKKKIENNQSSLEKVLSHLRVERRCGRSKGEWCPNINMAKVTKVVKGLLENFGFQDKDGIFLYPEEMLFLMEANRVEVSYKNAPLSIQEGYNILLHNDDCNFRSYMVFKKIVSSGYRVVSYKEILRKTSRNKHGNDFSNEKLSSGVTHKRKLEESGTSEEVKKIILDGETDVELKIHIDNVFEKMQSRAPKMYTSHLSQRNPEYCVFLPINKSRTNWDFSVFICDKNLPLISQSHKPSVYAFCVNDNISFLTVNNTNLPSLH